MQGITGTDAAIEVARLQKELADSRDRASMLEHVVRLVVNDELMPDDLILAAQLLERKVSSKICTPPLPEGYIHSDGPTNNRGELLKYTKRDMVIIRAAALQAGQQAESQKPAVIGAQPAPPESSDGDERANQWRRLALQFDGHRIQAIAHLKTLLAHPDTHAVAARAFLAAPPLSGDQVLAERIAQYAQEALKPSKPHWLLYDLIAAVKYYAIKPELPDARALYHELGGIVEDVKHEGFGAFDQTCLDTIHRVMDGLIAAAPALPEFDIDKERAMFEAEHPMPANCQWIGNGYAATEYNAWDAHKYADMWRGWVSSAKAAR